MNNLVLLLGSMLVFLIFLTIPQANEALEEDCPACKLMRRNLMLDLHSNLLKFQQKFHKKNVIY